MAAYPYLHVLQIVSVALSDLQESQFVMALQVRVQDGAVGVTGVPKLE